MTRRSAQLGILGVALLLSACGIAGPDETSGSQQPYPTSAAPERLQITTTRVPPAQSEALYPTTQLTARGGTGPLDWCVTSGALPDGMALEAGGVLGGSPAETGLYEFEVAVTDGWSADVKTLHLAVDTFAVSVQGLNLGEVWSGTLVTLEAIGNQGEVRFEVASNGSGGTFDRLEPDAGRAVYHVGPVTHACTDRIRAVDTATNEQTEVCLDVVAHPAPNHRAVFGASDVWFVDTWAHVQDHGFPCDWDAILRSVGLRSSSYVPTLTDRLASFHVRQLVLAELNTFFGRESDGTRGDGVAVSFPLERPEAPYEAPAPGSWSQGASHRYSVVGVVCGSQPGVLGVAFVDSHLNELVENDTTPTGGGELGVFGNVVANAFNFAYVNETLPNDPVGPGDEATLRALIHGRPVEGSRPVLVRKASEGFARATAMILAHEIGHSLGLHHTNPPVPGSIMGSGASIYPGATYAFTPEDVAQLRASLPGPGRQGAPASPASSAATLPDGGIDIFRAEPAACCTTLDPAE